jgi:hypothetical protein
MFLGDAVSLDCIRRQIGGDVHRYFLKAKLCRSLPPGVAHNDHTIGIDHNRLMETEFDDILDDWIYRGVVDTGVIYVRVDSIKRPHFDLHV